MVMSNLKVYQVISLPRFVMQEAYSKVYILMGNVTEIRQAFVELGSTFAGLSYTGTCHATQGRGHSGSLQMYA